MPLPPFSIITFALFIWLVSNTANKDREKNDMSLIKWTRNNRFNVLRPQGEKSNKRHLSHFSPFLHIHFYHKLSWGEVNLRWLWPERPCLFGSDDLQNQLYLPSCIINESYVVFCSCVLLTYFMSVRGNKRDWKEPTQAIKIPDTESILQILYIYRYHSKLMAFSYLNLQVNLLNQILFLQYTGSVPLKHQPTSV